MPRIIKGHTHTHTHTHTHMHTYSTDENNVKKTDMPAWLKFSQHLVM